MPDLPDDYPFLPDSTRSPLVDLGEVAARLGSAVVYDRRGEVLFADDFQYGLAPYTVATAGTGAEGKPTAETVDAGPYAAELIGGSDGARQAILARWQAPLAAAKYGLEVSFWLPGAIEYLELVMQYYDGSILQQGRFRYTWVGSEWSRFRSNGTYSATSIPGLAAATDPMFHWAKLVVDFSAGQYIRFMVNDAIYGFVNTDLREQASAVNPGLYVGVILNSRSGQNDRIVVGRFIITANEP